MVNHEFTGVDEIDELFDSPLFGVWIVVAFFTGALTLLSVSQDPAQTATLNFFFYMTIAGLIFVPFIDRDEPLEGREMLLWAAIGFAGLLGIAFISNVFVNMFSLESTRSLSLLPPNYLQLAVFGTLSLSTTALFSTLYFVATGEETLKGLGLYLFNIFPPLESFFGVTLPEVGEMLIAQPLIWIIVACWALAHTIIGQNPAWYCIPVFWDGLVIMYCNMKGGSWLTGIFCHAGNNLFFLGLALFLH